MRRNLEGEDLNKKQNMLLIQFSRVTKVPTGVVDVCRRTVLAKNGDKAFGVFLASQIIELI